MRIRVAFLLLAVLALPAAVGGSRVAEGRASLEGQEAPGGGTDPLVLSTFLGAGSHEGAYALAVDAAGAVYLAGYTVSSDLPTTDGAFQTGLGGGSDAFVVKLSPDGSQLLYATYLGGSGFELAYRVAVDQAGAAYVLGYTESADLPVTPGAFDGTYNGEGDLFIARLNPAGSALEFCTYVGGEGRDRAYGLALDAAGSAYVAGETESPGFPTTPGAFDGTYDGGPRDAVALRLSPAGDSLVFSTFLGSTQNDFAYGIAVDSAGSAYVLGDTYSPGFPVTQGASDTGYNGGRDSFVSRLDTGGSSLVYSTFLGGSQWDQSYALAVDGGGRAWATGATRSLDWPTTPDAFDTTFNGNVDAMVVGLDASGSSLLYSTFVGGSEVDGGLGLGLDGQGRVYATGDTASADFPTTPDAFDTTFDGGGRDAFVIELDPGNASRSYSTFLDGTGNGWGLGMAVDTNGDRGSVAGLTWSPDFPTTPGAFDRTHNGASDAFATRMRLNLPAPLSLVPDSPDGRAMEWHTFEAALRDPSGWDDIVSVRMVIGRRSSDPRGLTVLCYPKSEALYLRDPAAGWLGPCSPGDPAVLSNGIVELDCGQSTISDDGGAALGVSLRARWTRPVATPVELAGYLRAGDRSRNDSGFVRLASWALLPGIE